MTSFLEYEPDTVKVHGFVYRLDRGEWKLNKSFYRKLRLSPQWIEEQLKNKGFARIKSNIERGLVTLIATK